jgi:transcriptional regulator with XRE-family HTH domain/molybdate-binding protein
VPELDLDPALVGAQVRRRRRAAGLSQALLAEQAGVSRQAVSALEAGRHLPRVDAALAIAAALGTTVEELLTVEAPPALHVLDRPLVDGQAVLAAQVQPHTVCLPVPSAMDGESWHAPDAVVRDGRVELLAGADLGRFVIVGCDPALGIVADLLPQRGPGRLLPVAGSSSAARLALQVGRTHAAVVHDAHLPVLDRDDRVHRLVLARWRTGIAVDPDAPGAAKVLADALVGRGPVIQRDAGATAQAAYERALAAAGASPPLGPRAAGHLDAARRARESGHAAVTIEPVAAALGLRFHALETHTVEVWIDRAAVDHPGANALGEVLSSARFRTRLAVLPGYELGDVA